MNVDVAAARELGVPVTNTPGKNAEAVVELTIAFMIMLARGISRSQRFLMDGGQLGKSTFEGAEFFGGELGGRSLGVVGYGQVGRRVARIATAMGMEVLAYDPMIDYGSLERGVRAASLERLLAESDFVTLHARVTADNENLMSAEQFAAMPAGAFFINTAREGLVDEGALVAALQSGHLAARRSTSCRPADGRNPLLDLPNVVITPHIGGATFETIDRGIAMVADEIDAARRGPRAEVSGVSDLTLAIDAGTGSCRAVVFDRDGMPRRIRPAGVGAPRRARRARLPGVRHRPRTGSWCASACTRRSVARRSTRARSRRSPPPACARAWCSGTPPAGSSGHAPTSTRARGRRPPS